MKSTDIIAKPPTQIGLIKKVNETINAVNTAVSQDDIVAMEATEAEIESIFTGGN